MAIRWRKLLNIDTIVVVLVLVAVLYCIVKGKRRVPKGRFKGFVDSIESGEIPAPTFWEQSNYVSKASKKGRFKQPKQQQFNKSEERCREIFQQMFGVKFKSVRPSFLKNPVTGKNLELDGFNPDIRTPLGKGLAFEYDGEQHSKYNRHFHRSGESEFQYQVKKDEYKDVRCREEGILLIRIPHYIAYGDLERFIHTKVRKKMGDKFPSNIGGRKESPKGHYVWGGKMSKEARSSVATTGLYGY